MTASAEPFVIIADDAQVQRWFGALIERGDDLSGLMTHLGEHLVRTTQERFDTGVGPDGIAWRPLKDGSGRKPLLKTGTMRDNIFPTSGPDWVEISAGARQARWQQEGTDPYTIRPKSKKALAWPGGPGPRKVVHHPGLPARPFIGLSAEDGSLIEGLALAWLDSDATGA